MSQKLTWGIIGTGSIARTFARGITHSHTGKLGAVASRTQESAEKFAAEFGAAKAYGSYEALLADPEIRAVYISTPHPMHVEWAIKAAEAGKAILCEKPMGLNFAEGSAIIDACGRNRVFFMEAFMYRCHPYIPKLIELIRDKVIGDVCVIKATFSFSIPFNAESRLLNNSLGGGGILDVGCYPTSLVGLIAGVAIGKQFSEPLEVRATGKIGAVSRVDEVASAVVKYPGDIIGHLAAGVQVTQDNVVRIYGTKGAIFIPSPWIPAKEGGTVKIIINPAHENPREIVINCTDPLYSLEADMVGRHIEKSEAAWPAMTWTESLANMRTLDRWRDAIGMVYDAEKPENIQTVHRRPLVAGASLPPQRAGGRDAASTMRFGELPGIEKSISRLVFGVDNKTAIRDGAVVFDDFFERGGNCYDTAWVYGHPNLGLCEKVFGQWLRARKIRDQLVLIGKGAHTPECNPAALKRQLRESLDRLQTDHVDIYFMHRDNLDVPVGEFVDVLNEMKRAGRIKVFGGSNWTLGRVDAANAYAKSKGLQGFTAVSNNLALARAVDVPWAGCLSSGDAQSRAWFERTQTPLFCWSSQARGFFTERGNPADKSDEEMVRCWHVDDNFKRRDRAIELAKKYGVEPINIALAYVLAQPFPTFALIGPRTVLETTSSLKALGVELSQDEVKWLNLEK